jgi:signal transduction histidine kinase
VVAAVHSIADAMVGRGGDVEMPAPDVSVDVPAVVLGDTDRVRGVLLNLCSNAAKFTQRGAIRLRVSTVSAGGVPADRRTSHWESAGGGRGTGADALFAGHPAVDAAGGMDRGADAAVAMDGQTEGQTDRGADAHGAMDRQTDGQTDRGADADVAMDRQTDGQTDRGADADGATDGGADAEMEGMGWNSVATRLQSSSSGCSSWLLFEVMDTGELC